MYSIKPGRGPSLLQAIFGLVVGVPFVLFWITMASKSGAPAFLPIFGVLFLIMLLVIICASFYNASARDRISTHDITTEAEEGDPLRPKARTPAGGNKPLDATAGYCPFCGAAFKTDFKFCAGCGKERPVIGERKLSA